MHSEEGSGVRAGGASGRSTGVPAGLCAAAQAVGSRAHLADIRREVAGGVLQKGVWVVKLHHAASADEEDAIGVDDRVEAVRDGDDGAVREAAVDGLVHQLV